MRLWGYILRTLGTRGLAAVALSILSATSAVALASLSRHLASNQPPPSGQLVWRAGCILVAVLCDLAAKWLFIQISVQATWNLRRELARQILERPFDQLERIGASRLLTALTDDVAKTAQVLGGLPALLIAVAMTASCFVALACLSPRRNSSQ